MKEKSFPYLFLSLLTIVAFMGLVSSAITFNFPSSSSTITGIGVINVTVPITDSGNTNFTCNIYAGSALTANITWTAITEIHNNTAGSGGLLFINGTFGAEIIEDANDYSFNATCSNETGVFDDAVNTGITIDKGVPSSATSLTPAEATIDTDGSVSFSATVLGENTTSCTLRFQGRNPGESSYAMTHSGNTCTFTLANIAEQTYEWFVRASDESQTADSSNQKFSVDVSSGAGGSLTPQQLRSAELERKGIRSPVLAIVIIGAMIFGAIMLTKKRRK